MKTAILIPCYNEEITIAKVIQDLKRECPDAAIYVYDNNSTDKTYEIASSLLPAGFVRKEPRQGKGNVVRTMFRDIDADIYVLVDGDDQHPVNAIHDLIEPILTGQADMVIGDRLSNGTYAKENKRAFHKFGNSLIKNMLALLFGSKLNDIMAGFRAFSRFYVKGFPILSQGFEIETEMTVYALHHNYKVKEIPTIHKDRPEGSVPKLNTFRDGIKVIKTILRLFKNYKPFQFFALMSLAISIIGFIVGFPVIKEFITTGHISAIPSAILASSLEVIAILFFCCSLILDVNVEHAKYMHEQISVLYTSINTPTGEGPHKEQCSRESINRE